MDRRLLTRRQSLLLECSPDEGSWITILQETCALASPEGGCVAWQRQVLRPGDGRGRGVSLN